MELIPILSTIILVATISTFVLAIGAYILYKVQEGKADRIVRKGMETEQAEVMEPADLGGRKLVLETPVTKKTVVHNRYRPVQPVTDLYQRTGRVSSREKPGLRKKSTEPKFMKFTSQGYVTTDEDQNSGTIRWR